jgi:hypothetical protein
MPALISQVTLKPCSFAVGFTYNFATDGGATGTFTTPAHLPFGAMIKRIYFKMAAALTSGGAATIQLVCGAAPFTAALPFTDGVFASATAFGSVDDVQAPNPGVGTVLGNVFNNVIGQGGRVDMVLGGANLTAGSFQCLIDYWL